MHARPLLLTWLLLAVILCAPAQAGMEEALDLVDKADKALAAQDYDAAATGYREALAEAADCVPAQYGLGQALLASQKKTEAIVAFRRVLRTLAKGVGIPAAWNKYERESRSVLEAQDEKGKALEEQVEDYVTEVVRLAAKYKTKDPDLAVRALQIALALRPAHERATELLGKLLNTGARTEEIFDGKQIDDWDGGRGQWWSVKDGVIVSETKGVATFIRNQKEITGNFDVIMEARIAQVHDDAPFLALMAGWQAEYDHTRLGTLTGALTWYEYKGEDDKERVFREEADRLVKPYDPSAWTLYELRYREKYIHALVNGREVAKTARPERRTGGYVGILSQGCRGEVKRLQVIYR